MTIENFNKFYDEYQRFSAYVAYCITKDKLLAEDISQEIFITLYKMREKNSRADFALPENHEQSVKNVENQKKTYTNLGGRAMMYSLNYARNAQW